MTEETSHLKILMDMFPHLPKTKILELLETVGVLEKESNKYEDLNFIIDMILSNPDATLLDNQFETYDEAVGGTFLESPKSIDILKYLQDVLPNASPDFLKENAEVLRTQSIEKLDEFIIDAIENKNYPSYEDYVKTKKKESEISLYADNFDVESFIKIFPNPFEQFKKSKLPEILKEADEEKIKDYEEYILNLLYNRYLYHRKKDINILFVRCERDLFKLCNKLECLPRFYKTPRKLTNSDKTIEDILLLQEVAFLTHRKEIKKVLKMKDENYKKLKEEATLKGLMQTCECCFDSELIPEECYFCNNGCIFCKECIIKATEINLGNMIYDFPCLGSCDGEFSIVTLQMVLDPAVFRSALQKKQMMEIAKAKVDGIETCPFCEFSTIPEPDDKIFHCLNEECGKETCRECRNLAHVPLRCEEIEYEEDVKMRTYVENKMTEKLLRKCWNCNKQFLKESGCNKMQCSCGAFMCYICRQPITDYSHFGDGKCPLYLENLENFHAKEALNGGLLAKQELGIGNGKVLKIDPTKDFDL